MAPHLTMVHERAARCRAGANPALLARMPSGWAVLGDNQFLPGYSLLLADPTVDHLADLEDGARARFLLDMSLLGQALLDTTSCARVHRTRPGRRRLANASTVTSSRISCPWRCRRRRAGA
jgi:hypothetical protein